MHFNPYGGPAAELAAALVNVDRDALRQGSATAVLDRVFATYSLITGPVTDAEVSEIMAWADRLSPAFGESDVDKLVDVVNGLLRDSASRPYISRHDGKPPHLHFAREGDGPINRARAYTAAGVAHVLCVDPTRLGRCDNDSCDIVYVDTSRNGRRRFCSTRCATRVHVADHRSRVAQA